jgi:hypothetical protein
MYCKETVVSTPNILVRKLEDGSLLYFKTGAVSEGKTDQVPMLV